MHGASLQGECMRSHTQGPCLCNRAVQLGHACHPAVLVRCRRELWMNISSLNEQSNELVQRGFTRAAVAAPDTVDRCVICFGIFRAGQIGDPLKTLNKDPSSSAISAGAK